MSTADTTVQRAIHALYSDHHGWLYAWLRKKLGCAHNAADVAHDTFARIIASRDLLALREPRAYLATAAKRLLIDQARRRRLEAAYLAELAQTVDAMEGFPAPEQVLEAVQALDLIAQVLAGLSAKPRQAFLLHYLDGLTHAAVAAQLGVSTKMVQKYLVQALLHCDRALEPA